MALAKISTLPNSSVKTEKVWSDSFLSVFLKTNILTGALALRDHPQQKYIHRGLIKSNGD